MNRAIFGATLAFISPLWVAAEEGRGPACENWAAKVAVAEHRRDSGIQELRSVRRYLLHNARWKKDAVMTVLFTQDESGRKRYSVLDQQAEGIQREVLERILKGEVEASGRKEEDASFSPRNYEFTPIGYQAVDGKKFLVVQVKPRRKSKVLLEGRAWIDTEEASIYQMEGRPSKSLSFWVGKPYVKQDFRKVGDFWLSSTNHSTADVRLLGKTDLTIQYLDYSITPKHGEILMACTRTCSPHLAE